MIASLRGDYPDIRRSDIVAAVLLGTFDAASVIYLLDGHGVDVVSQGRVSAVMGQIRAFSGSRVVSADSISREENRSELIRMIDEIQTSMVTGEIEKKDGLKMIADIRVKLNDKFEIEDAEAHQRLIVVPQKHDMVCRYTNRECMFPPKEECMARYGLVERGG